MSTDFTPNDIRFYQSNAHSTITLDSGSEYASVIEFLSGSNNISSPTTASTYYTSINHLFYQKHSNGDQGVYYYYSNYQFPLHKNKFPDNGLIIDISSDRYDRYIKPGTFSYYDSTEDVDFILKDDSNGNLYSVNPQLSQSADTSISSSDNYIGNIFYEHGLVVITETGSFHNSGSGQFYVSGGTNYSMSFDSSVQINTLEYSCKFLPNQYNWSTNPTRLSGSNTIVTSSFYIDNDTTRPEFSASDHLRNFSGRVLNLRGNEEYYPILHQESKSIWRINDGIIDPKYLNTMPYITKLAFRNEYDEIIMTATLEHPLQKRNDETMTLKVQMDF